MRWQGLSKVRLQVGGWNRPLFPSAGAPGASWVSFPALGSRRAGGGGSGSVQPEQW